MKEAKFFNFSEEANFNGVFCGYKKIKGRMYYVFLRDGELYLIPSYVDLSEKLRNVFVGQEVEIIYVSDVEIDEEVYKKVFDVNVEKLPKKKKVKKYKTIKGGKE